MASSYIADWIRGRMIPTFRFRKDTNRMDGDIASDPTILVERSAYEERHHFEIASLIKDEVLI